VHGCLWQWVHLGLCTRPLVIPLSASELNVLSDRDFLMAKQRLTEKVVKHLAQTERELQAMVATSGFPFPEGTQVKAGKIAKGENYRQLPYFVLDYPRLFSHQSTFAFRSMLWWGHQYSCTLHLSGDALMQFRESLLTHLPSASDYFCIHQTPWEYHFGSDNYVPLSTLNANQIEQHLAGTGFVKVSNFTTLENWANFPSFTREVFARFLTYLMP